MQEVNPEQKEQLMKLYRSTIKKNLLIGLKYGVILFILNIIVTTVAILYLDRSQGFILGGAFINALFMFPKMSSSIRAENDRVVAEAKKILNQQ